MKEVSPLIDVEIAADGTAWVSCGGGINGTYPSSLWHFKLVGNQLTTLGSVCFGDAIKGFSIDASGNAWVASQKDDTIYAVAPDATVIGSYVGAGISGPWSTTVDGEGNVSGADFGPLTLAENETYSARVSVLAGANAATRPPGLAMGDPITPETGYTVPSAGSEVLFHNGQPLYGPNAPPTFDPMQRTTKTVIDSAGNLWAVNNWKNNFGIDNTINPGGDGVVIFVGLAAPPQTAGRASSGSDHRREH